MPEDLKHGWSLVWVETKGLIEEVQSILSDVVEPFLSTLLLDFGENVEHFFAKVSLERL